MHRENIVHNFWNTFKSRYHGDGAMQVEGKECICEQCEIMSDEKKQSLKGGSPKVRQVKLRIMMTEPI